MESRRMQLHDAPIELRDLKSNGPTKIQRCAEWFKAVSTLTAMGRRRPGIREKDVEEAVNHKMNDKSIQVAKSKFREVINPEALQEAVDADLLNDCFDFYCRFLESRFQIVNSTHFEPCLYGAVSYGCPRRAINKTNMYHFLTDIAELISTKEKFALQDLITYQNDIRASDPSIKELLVQLVFLAFGWMTTLYDPVVHLISETLRISRQSRTSGRGLKTELFHVFEQDFRHVQQPSTFLLCSFGDMIPKADQSSVFTDPSISPITAESSNNSEALILSYLSFQTLGRVAGITIDWVDSLNLHLDFDEADKVLKLYRFPSFCRLMYSTHGKDPFFARLFSNRPSDPQPRRFFREVLLSYRLIFGQNSSSWSDFNKTFKNYNGVTKDGNEIHDPLLPRLCGQPWRKERKFYEELDAASAPNHYSPGQDFPFLGKRLLRLQRFSKEQNPHDWKVLWHDRRDIMRFYTFWAVLWLGGTTIFIALLQLASQTAFEALQLKAANEQNRLQRIANGL